MKFNNLLEELSNLSKIKKNWYSTATVYADFKNQLAGQAHPQRRMREALDATGYSKNTLNRMLAVKDFFDSHKSLEKLKDIDPNQLSFSSLEIVKRLYQINPKLGLTALFKIADGEYKIRELKELYNQAMQDNISVASVRQSSARESRHFEQSVISVIEENFEELTGRNTVNKKIIGSRSNYFSSVMATSEADPLNESTSHTGFYIYFTLQTKDLLDSTVQISKRVKFYSSFFEQYWVFIPEKICAEMAERLIMLFDILELKNSGIATFIQEDNTFILRTLRQPKSINEGDWYIRQGDYIDYCESFKKV